MTPNDVPASAMIIVAHPDDAEFGVAGTAASWARAGCHITYVLCTDGNAGSHEPGMTPERLAEIRRAEQRAACTLLGVKEVVFLGYNDGQLEPTLQLRQDLVQVIRKYRPEVVFTTDPTRLYRSDSYINHPDHRAAGQATLDAVAPGSSMPLLWPELGPPHQVEKVFVIGNDEPNRWIDISKTIDLKIAALRLHVSQLGSWDPTDRIKRRGSDSGQEHGYEYAESFRVFTLRRAAED